MASTSGAFPSVLAPGVMRILEDSSNRSEVQGLKDFCHQQDKQISILITALKFYTLLEGTEGEYAKQILKEIEEKEGHKSLDILNVISRD